jgi:ATP-binding cassette subfamily C protein
MGNGEAAPRVKGTLGRVMETVRGHFLWTAFFSALLNLLFLAPSIYMLQVYDRVVPTRGTTTLLALTLVLLFSLATLAALDALRSRLLVRASIRLEKQLAPDILDATFADTRRSGSVNRQILRDFDTLRQSLTGPAVLALFDAPWTPIYICVCFLIHPAIGALALCGALLLLLLGWLNERATKDRTQKAAVASGLAYASQDQTAANAEVVRALGMRQALVARHVAERRQSGSLQSEANFASSRYVSLTKFVRLALQSLALGLGALLAVENLISGGAIFASSFLAARALGPMEQIIGAWRSIVQARAAYAELGDLLDRGSACAAKTILPPPTGKIDVEAVTVTRAGGEAPILHQVSFELAPGEVLALIGPSGAGKSTLARVLSGATPADAGYVRFDGAEMKEWEPERLARHIGYVAQEPCLFSGTIKENIARFQTNLPGGDSAETDAAVIEAARLCGAHEMILQLPGGYDFRLGWGGRGLSAGQSQQIALARALYGQPRIVILDEPNAHLDNEAESRLVKTISFLKAQGASVLLIAHRMGVLSVVDSLLVLRNGHVELKGTRDEVLKTIASPRVVPTSLAREQA